ncbi:uncharacterized protein LOC134747424 [Cydia strobilella]|uniref:uncharacterized protein LOC134747424 n=1 Tax=Cydia strobilella TaxID=1100964 RepID=UPI0030042FB8
MVKLNKMEAHLLCLPGLRDDVKDIKLELSEVKNSCETNRSNLTECNSRLDEVEKKIPDLEANNVKINSLNQQIDQLKREITNRDQWHRLNNIEVKGVPLKNNENLFTILERIGEIVGFPIQTTCINYISRIPVHNSKEKSIIVSFVNRYVKENFIASARLRKTISTEELGFRDCHSKIFVNDHLTPEYKMLLTKTKTELKSMNYKYVWVKFAKIHVRRDDNSKPKRRATATRNESLSRRVPKCGEGSACNHAPDSGLDPARSLARSTPEDRSNRPSNTRFTPTSSHNR